MDYSNKHLVSVTGANEIVVLNPPRGPMSPVDALALAAWLVALAEYKTDRTFTEILAEVQSV
jgi:hypothetical protein